MKCNAVLLHVNVFFSARQTALTNAVNIQAKVRPFRNECPNNSDGRDGKK